MIMGILLSQTSLLSAATTSQDDDNNIISRISDEINSITDKIFNNEEKEENVSNIDVHNYNELMDAVADLNKKNDSQTYQINLEDGDYNITDVLIYSKKYEGQNLIINGNGHTIDGNNKEQFMYLNNVNITLKNAIIQNTVYDENKSAGVFEMISPSNLTIVNSTFNNNLGDKKGSVITNRGNTKIINSTFKNNTANHVGGAIWSTGEYGGSLNLSNNTFENNIANVNDNNERTAIVYSVAGGLNIIDNNKFINNTGRCIHCFNYTSTNITNNVFDSNKLNDSEVIRGAIIDNYESNISIKNNVFTNDQSSGEIRGGILYHEIGKMEFINNTVENNHIVEGVTSTAKCSKGGVIFNRNATADIKNNTFKNKMTGNLSRGGVLYNNMGNVTLEDNKFENTIEGNEIRGLIVYTDVASVVNVKNNDINVNLIGSALEDPDNNKEIYNSNQKMDESDNSRAVVNYE